MYEFDNPPINEVVCGILFKSLEDLRAAHFGLLWEKFRPDFSITEDQNIILPLPTDVISLSNKVPLPRVWFIHKNENAVIQVQRNHFLYNWRKRRPADEYPGYQQVIKDFEHYKSVFEKFLEEEKIGSINAIRYEMTYIDLLPCGEGWETLNEIDKLLSDVFSPDARNSLLKHHITNINWQTVYTLPENRGTLKILIQNGTAAESQPVIRLEFTAMTLIDKDTPQTMRDWSNVVHDLVYQIFINLINGSVQETYWGRKDV